MGGIEYTHFITDDGDTIDEANLTGQLNDGDDFLDPAIVQGIAITYGSIGVRFGIVVLTNTFPRASCPDETELAEWNSLLAAAQPILDGEDTFVICVTSRPIRSSDIVAPGTVHIVTTCARAMEIIREQCL